MSKNETHLAETVEKRVSTPMGVKKVNVPKDLQTRENEMKQFFEGMEEPQNTNPNIQKKSDMEMGFFKQLSKMVDFDVMWNGLLAYKPTFRSEQEVLDYLIKVRTRMQFAFASMFVVGFGTFATFGPYHLDMRLKVSGFMVSAFCGVIFAKLKTNIYSADIITRWVEILCNGKNDPGLSTGENHFQTS